MGLREVLSQEPADFFPNRLAGKAPEVPSCPWSLLALLVLACLTPRACAAWNWNTLWADTLTYLGFSEALARGDTEAAFGELGLNIYPVILWGLRGSGLDWKVLGEWWSVGMASLTVLPLFGWVRRQFDERVAIAACLLYAMHPKLVVVSPLIIRDPTFWFLFNLSIYLMWRAVVELRWWLFPATGVALSLSVHTRTEGWLLLVPLVLWSVYRLPSVAGARVRLAAGSLVCIAVIPLSVALVNFTWLRHSPHWEMIRSSHVEIAWQWVRSFHQPAIDQSEAAQGRAATGRPPAANQPPAVNQPPATSQPPTTKQPGTANHRGTAGQPPVASQGLPAERAAEATATLAPMETPLSGFTLIRKLVLRWLKAFSYVYALLGVMGMSIWWRIFFRRDHGALPFMGVLLLTAVAIRYSQVELDIRYFLPLVMLALPWMAVGLISISRCITRLTQRYVVWGTGRRLALVTGCLVCVGLLGVPSMKLTAGPMMYQRAELGRWILHRLGPNQAIAARIRASGLVAYYAEGRFIGDAVLPVIEAGQPEVVLLEDNARNRECWETFSVVLERKSGPRYRRVSGDGLPPGSDEVLFLLRGEGSARAAVPQAARRRTPETSR